MSNILDEYVHTSPAAQNAVNIFKGEWTSRVPGVEDTGHVDLFADARITWAIERFGGVEGKSVLELGPLEGGHTSMLVGAGASEVLAIEANTRSYLKCLIVKEILALDRCHFLLGDFVQFLRADDTSFDACVASGVLYHMHNPVELLGLIARSCRQVMLWTHYYDEAVVERSRTVREKFQGSGPAVWQGFRHTLHHYYYGDALRWAGYCGGSATSSSWLSQEDILGALRHFGMDEIELAFEQPDHPNGPSLALIARR